MQMTTDTALGVTKKIVQDKGMRSQKPSTRIEVILFIFSRARGYSLRGKSPLFFYALKFNFFRH